MSIKILLADDHGIVREGLRNMLEAESDLTVVGEADNGRTAVKLARELRPDVIVMDISMPDLNGIEAARQVADLGGKIRIVCLSMHQEKKFVSAMLHAGASGYVLKSDVTRELTEAIRKVMAGGVYLSPAIAGGVVKEYVRGRRDPARGVFTELSAREREILQLIAEGYSTKEIASRLKVSDKTVGAHREHIMEKLELHNVAALTRYAIREGLASL